MIISSQTRMPHRFLQYLFGMIFNCCIPVDDETAFSLILEIW